MKLTEANIIAFCDTPSGRTKDEIATHFDTAPMAITRRLSKLRNRQKLFYWQSFLGGSPKYFAQWEHAQAYLHGSRDQVTDRAVAAAVANASPLPPPDAAAPCVYTRYTAAPYTVARAGADDFRGLPSKGAF